eukprot:COSAG01_NODE_3448_length_6086_cov_4.407049_8_plen_432_part_00
MLNDAPFSFNGTVTIRILNVVTGTSFNLTQEWVSLAPGPKLSQWFCAHNPETLPRIRHPALVEPDDGTDKDDAIVAARQVPTEPVGGYVMVLVSRDAYPEHGRFNHEAAGITSEAGCLASCLANHSTCKGVTWLTRPAEPCIHYQDVAGAIIRPSTGCHYYKIERSAPYTVTAGLPSDRSNFSKALAGKAASVADCEAACNADAQCLGFTKYNHGSSVPGSWRNNCWMYRVVPSLVSGAGVSWHQKPGTQPIPRRPPAPTPAPAPAPAPAPPPPVPPPPGLKPLPQLNCTSWPHTTGWQAVGCDAIGGNCVLLIDVYNQSDGHANSSPESWSVVPFQPPKHQQLAPAKISWSIGPVSADGNRVKISLRSNATALYVVLTTAAQGRFSDNAFLLRGGVVRDLDFLSWSGAMDSAKVALLQSTLRVEHLADNL